MRQDGWPGPDDEWDAVIGRHGTATGPYESYPSRPGSGAGREHHPAPALEWEEEPFRRHPVGESNTLPRGMAAHEAPDHPQFGFAEPPPDVPGEDSYATSWEFEEGLARLLRTSAPDPAPPKIPRQRYAHRKRRRRLAGLAAWAGRLAGRPVPWLRLVSWAIAALTALIVAVVSGLSGVISYDPLRRLAAHGRAGVLADLWPLLVYGPWLVAALSILRAALYRRRAAHSWFVVVLFSAVAVYMCVAHVGHGPVRLAVAGLPPVTALVCFHQLVRQVTLTSPPRAVGRRPRHTARRG